MCTYTDARFEQLADAVASLEAQLRCPDEVVVVVDHNPPLLERVRAGFEGVMVIPNAGPPGLSGARNSGVTESTGDVVAFLDDDARAEDGWLEALIEPYGSVTVAGTGGLALPVWPGGRRPPWFPPEFDWVVGCSYTGLPETEAPVRNLLGAGMSFRRSVLDAVGGFDSSLGRMGALPLGCEETEVGIRIGQQLPAMTLLHVPSARVAHCVSDERTTVGYFIRRCFAEGVSKAAVSALVGRRDALSTERRYVRHVLPSAVARDLAALAGRDAAGGTRVVAVVAGLVVTSAGFGIERVRAVLRSRRRSPAGRSPR